MSSYNFYQTLLASGSSGSALTAAAAASALPPVALFNWPSNYLKVDDKIVIRAQGIISNAVTTPGTGRFDVRMGSTVIADSGAFNLNVVAKANVPYWLEIDLLCLTKGAGTGTTFEAAFRVTSEAIVGSPLASAGGAGTLVLPAGGPAAGTGIDCTISNKVDVFWTQTVATGSQTMKMFEIALLT